MWRFGAKLYYDCKNFYSHIPCGMWRAANYSEYERYEISTHTSRVGCDAITVLIWCGNRKFLLTHPVWDVTQNRCPLYIAVRISTHTSRVGCDWKVSTDTGRHSDFYSHIPCGMWLRNPVQLSSFHHFYSHIPCGMWLGRKLLINPTTNFYSHIPCGMWHLDKFVLHQW